MDGELNLPYLLNHRKCI